MRDKAHSRLSIASVSVLVVSGCPLAHNRTPAGQVLRSANPKVTAQIANIDAKSKSPSTASFGDLRGTDYLNFTSQNLVTHGWKKATT
jgi:hypothetical protein